MSNQRRSTRRMRRGASKAAVAAVALPGVVCGCLAPSPSAQRIAITAPADDLDRCSPRPLVGDAFGARFEERNAVLTLGPDEEVFVTGRGCIDEVAEVLVVSDGSVEVGAVVPKPGTGVSAHGSSTDGGEGVELHVMTLANGVVVASSKELPAAVDDLLSERFPELGWGKRPAEAPLPVDEQDHREGDVSAMNNSTECTEQDRNSQGRRESDNHTWRANLGTYPAYLNAQQTTADFQAGPDGWETFPRSDCLSIPFNSIQHNYAGGTNLMPNMTAAPTCQSGNGSNTWAFRVQNAANRLATTCSWWTTIPFFDDEVTEADVAFNTNVTWGHTVDQCTPEARKHMVVSAATHEAGHVFGFGHVDQASEQTMVPTSPACSKAWSTLGRGDMRGAQEVYAP
jgi:hypothetical protein